MIAPSKQGFFASIREVQSEEYQRKFELVENGARVVIGQEEFDVGSYLPDLNAWDLLQDGHRALTVRADILVNIAESLRPRQTAS